MEQFRPQQWRRLHELQVELEMLAQQFQKNFQVPYLWRRHGVSYDLATAVQYDRSVRFQQGVVPGDLFHHTLMSLVMCVLSCSVFSHVCMAHRALGRV